MEFSAAFFLNGVDLSGYLMHNHSHIPATLSVLTISASAILPVNSFTSPRATVRSDPFRPPATVPRALVRGMRRIRRRSATEDDSDDGFFDSGDGGFFDGGDGDDGPFGGGNGGGRGWNSWRSGGSEGKEPDRHPWLSSSVDPAFDVIYKMLCWIALSNCAYFAFKKMSKLLAEREKGVLIRLVLPFS